MAESYGRYNENVIDSQLNMQNVQDCVNPDTSKKKSFQTFQRAGINDDKLTVDLDNLISLGPGLYHLDNQYGCECGLKEAKEIQVSQPGIHLKGGLGWIAEKGCLVDNDTKLRQDESKMTNKNDINQIIERLFITTPDLRRGFHDVDVETVLLNSESIKDQKPCNGSAGFSSGNYFLPMIQKLSDEVQDTNHIIPEDSMNEWVRGGLPTRQMVRNSDYLRRCQQKTL